MSLSCCNYCNMTACYWLKKNNNKHWGLCIKVGRGQGDRDIGTRVWGLGTWGRVGRDVGTSSMGRGDVWDGDGDGDAGTSNIGTRGTWGR